MLSEIKGAPIHVGLKQSRRALEEGLVAKAFVANDADPAVVRPFLEGCARKKVPVEFAETMRELGAAAGIDVGAAIVVILKAIHNSQCTMHNAQ